MAMAIDPDPYRTLGVGRGATREEIRRAYRRMAKIHHPDAAGPGALPRFLAIQAAYEQLILRSGGRTGRASPGRPSPRRPSEPDADRTDATRRAYGGRARTGGTHGTTGTTPPRGGAQGTTAETGEAGTRGTTGPGGAAAG